MRTKNSQIFFLLSSLFFFTFLLKGEILARQNACPTTTGTSLTLNQTTVGATSCAFTAQVDGVDNGILEIGPDFTLTIGSVSNQTIVFGTVRLIKPATIIINKNGSALKKGYLFYRTPDSDGDGYVVVDTTQKYYNSSPTYSNCNGAPCVRVSLASTVQQDCNDNNALVQVIRTQYIDSDGDTYTVTGSSFCASAKTWNDSSCSTAGSNYAKNSSGSCVLISQLSGTDCCDTNANVNPGQTQYFTTAHSCSGVLPFDYNCNGQEEKQYPSVSTDSWICSSLCMNFTPGWKILVPSCGASDYWLPGTCDPVEMCVPIMQQLTQACR